MGTSSMYGGPKKSPLLPKDFDGDNNEQTNTEQDGQNGSTENVNPNEPDIESDPQQVNSGENSWQSSKNTMSKYISGGKTNGIKKPLSAYVKSHKGAANAARSAKVAIKTTSKLGYFLYSISTSGIASTLNQYKIDYTNKTPNEIIDSIFNELAPTPDTKEDSIARKALVNTMSKLYELLEDNNQDIDQLNNIDNEFCIQSMALYIECYITERIMNDLGMRFEKSKESISRILTVEKEMKEYIHSVVSIAFKEKNIDFNSMNNGINPTINHIYKDCYKVMEDQL